MAAAGAEPEGRDSTTFGVLCRITLLFAFAASGALYVQYLNPAASPFCGLSSGCEAVRRSGFSYFFGSRFLSIPLVGLLAYGVVFASSLVGRRRSTLLLAAAGAMVALVLVAVQAFVVKAFCWLCLVVDVSAVLAAVLAYLDDRTVRAGGRPFADPLERFTWVALSVLATSVPVVWAKVKPAPPVPDVIRALYEPNVINVVEFADFECPYCRALYPVLKHVMESYPPEKVRFVRKHVPLPSHPDARPAARAAVCAEKQGKGEALADRLMQIELSSPASRRAAVGVGVDPVAFDRCMASTEPDARIDADTKLLEDAGMAGLPTTYIGGRRLLGAVSEEAIRDAFEHAARGDAETGVPGSVFAPLAVLVLLGTAWLGRARRVKLVDA